MTQAFTPGVANPNDLAGHFGAKCCNLVASFDAFFDGQGHMCQAVVGRSISVKQKKRGVRRMWMLEGETTFTEGIQMRHADLEIVNETENYLFMDQSNTDGKDETEFDVVPEDLTEGEV
ncbi:hypothetical protein TNCV_4445211 [Trichonephila clavipes]|nr:hypothetical protein TNCV_4445211 [Trichonephila clavipes]